MILFMGVFFVIEKYENKTPRPDGSDSSQIFKNKASSALFF